MNNHKLLQKISLEPYQIKKGLESIIHTILFNRLFVKIKPETIDCSLFDISYVKIKDQNIDDKVNKFISELYEQDSSNIIDITINFYYINTKSWLNSKILWEKWILPIEINKYEKLFKKTNELKKIIESVISISDSNYLNIPPIIYEEKDINELFDFEYTTDKESVGKSALNILKAFTDLPSFKF